MRLSVTLFAASIKLIVIRLRVVLLFLYLDFWLIYVYTHNALLYGQTMPKGSFHLHYDINCMVRFYG